MSDDAPLLDDYSATCAYKMMAKRLIRLCQRESIMKRIALLWLITFIYTTPVKAEYYAHGDIYGYTYDFIGKMVPHFGKLSAQKIYAIKHSDGKIFNKLNHIYQDADIEVTPQNECIFRPNDEHLVYLGRKSDGSNEELKVIYLKFECSRH